MKMVIVVKQVHILQETQDIPIHILVYSLVLNLEYPEKLLGLLVLTILGLDIRDL